MGWITNRYAGWLELPAQESRDKPDIPEVGDCSSTFQNPVRRSQFVERVTGCAKPAGNALLGRRYAMQPLRGPIFWVCGDHGKGLVVFGLKYHIQAPLDTAQWGKFHYWQQLVAFQLLPSRFQRRDTDPSLNSLWMAYSTPAPNTRSCTQVGIVEQVCYHPAYKILYKRARAS